MIFTLLTAFANGGASLTGIEAVSDAVGAFRPPEGRQRPPGAGRRGHHPGHAGGRDLLAGARDPRHARSDPGPRPSWRRRRRSPSAAAFGRVLFYLLQAATALILFTGANTSFNGFPFLASYVAGDAFLPRWLLKRGHRLVFSNAIVVLTVVSIALIIIRGANVNDLVPLYAIGVFTAFSMAGFGMARYHLRRKEPGWRRRLIINAAAGVLTAIVVLIFAVVKFTEGAWIVVVLFLVLVPALIRLNREYAMEAEVLNTISGRQPPPPPTYSRRTVFVFVDSFDLATLAALRYARSLRPTTLRAVHFVIDSARAEMLRQQWMPRRPRRRARLHRRPGPAAGPGRGRTGQRRGRGARHARDRDPAPAQLLAAARPVPARPDRGQDRRSGQPHPPLGGHDHPVRRVEPGGAAAGAAGREGAGPRRRSATIGPTADASGAGTGSTARPQPDRAARPGKAQAAAQGPQAASRARPPDGYAQAGAVRRASTRSAAWPSRAGPPSRAGCAAWRSARWSTTPCSPARSRTPPAS